MFLPVWTDTIRVQFKLLLCEFNACCEWARCGPTFTRAIIEFEDLQYSSLAAAAMPQTEGGAFN